MWSHYTVDGSGFVIAYDVEELRNLCATEDYLRPVRYSKKPPFRAACKILIDSERRKNTQASSDVGARQLARF